MIISAEKSPILLVVYEKLLRDNLHNQNCSFSRQRLLHLLATFSTCSSKARLTAKQTKAVEESDVVFVRCASNLIVGNANAAKI